MTKKSVSKISKIMKEFGAINDQDIDAFIRENIGDWLARLEGDDNKDLTFVTITGYTPEFNDGEPCEHCDYVEFSNRFSAFGEYVDYTQYSVNKCDKEIVAINDFFLMKFKTNYQVKIEIDPETKMVTNVTINKKYDCGH